MGSSSPASPISRQQRASPAPTVSACSVRKRSTLRGDRRGKDFVAGLEIERALVRAGDFDHGGHSRRLFDLLPDRSRPGRGTLIWGQSVGSPFVRRR